MKYFMVTAKCGHVGKNYFYKGNLFIEAENGKAAALKARFNPRVKHDHKDAILKVTEIDYFMYLAGLDVQKTNPYYSCSNIQEQREILSEIEQNIYEEDWVRMEPKKYPKKHSLKYIYNEDPEFESYRKTGSVYSYAA